MCRCDCGSLKKVRMSHLRSGDTKSCGCLMRELTGKRFTTHGLSVKNGKQTRIHRIWSNMKARCSVLTHQSYKNYGGRGIRVCDEWFNNFMAFYGWAIQNGYSENLTIERKDNDGPYSPHNCTWVTKGQNARNQRTTRLTMEKAEKIRQLAASGISQEKIASLFKISRRHTQNIIHNRRWRETE